MFNQTAAAFQEGAKPASPIIVQSGVGAAARVSLSAAGYSVPAFFFTGALMLGALVVATVLLAVASLLALYVHQYAAAVPILLLAGAAFLGLPYLSRKYFNVTAGYVAVVTQLITQGRVDAGSAGLFAYGRKVIRTQLGEPEVLHGFHTKLDRTLSQLLRALDRADDYVPGLSVLSGLVARLKTTVRRYIQWLILSYGLSRGAHGEAQFDRAAVEGTCYVVQNGATLLKTAIFVAALERITSVVVGILSGIVLVTALFVTMYAGLYGLDLAALSELNASALTQGDILMPLVISLLVAIVVGPILAYLFLTHYMSAVFGPFSLAMMLLKFHEAIQNQRLNPEWEARIQRGDYATDRLDWLSFRAL